jgi:hypothetical protein
MVNIQKYFGANFEIGIHQRVQRMRHRPRWSFQSARRQRRARKYLEITGNARRRAD